jgi:predicted enzyme related to lactoylglutathione lyase
MNRVVHFEIHASDVDTLKKFYSEVFGWEMQQMGGDYGNYVVVKTGPGPQEIGEGGLQLKDVGINGGMMMRNAPKSPTEGVGPNAFVCIVGVDNLDAYFDKAKAAGGTVAMDKMDVPKGGSHSILQRSGRQSLRDDSTSNVAIAIVHKWNITCWPVAPES